MIHHQVTAAATVKVVYGEDGEDDAVQVLTNSYAIVGEFWLEDFTIMVNFPDGVTLSDGTLSLVKLAVRGWLEKMAESAEVVIS